LSEIRKDYVTDTWVVISQERARRPKDFIKTHQKIDGTRCAFCEGNEHMTPPEIFAFRGTETQANSPGWWIRTVPNKFPALRIEGDLERKSSSIFTSISGIGCHEVIIETPEHDKPLALLTLSQVKEVIEMYRQRLEDLSRDRRFKYILIFENHGAEAGASLEHPHSQIIATPMIPLQVAAELRGSDNYFTDMGGECIYDAVISEERRANERVVFENNSFLCIAPYASRYPYEVMILPKKHQPSFADIGGQDVSDLAEILKRTLGSIYTVLHDPPYNFYIHTSPVNVRDYTFYHWHIEVTPAVSKLAGFERGTGFYINSMPPETAALYLSGRHDEKMPDYQLATEGMTLKLREES